MKTFASLARDVAVAAAVVAAATLLSSSAWARGGSGYGARRAGTAAADTAAAGMAAAPGAAARGMGMAGTGATTAIGPARSGAASGSASASAPSATTAAITVATPYARHYPPITRPDWGVYYDAPLIIAPVYSRVEGDAAPRSGQPVPQAARRRPDLLSQERTERGHDRADRRECNRWATTQPGAMADASIFQRATLACMEGRGYTVK